MTLLEFLVARIAEDEHEATWAQGCARSAERVLADCEAKLRIVERCRPIDRTLLADAPESARCAWDVIDILGKATLRDLARPYADHPDFREEWQPDA